MASDIGHLLCTEGLIDEEQLRAVEEAARTSGGTIPELLVLSGFIDDEELAEFFRTRLLIRRVHPNSLVKLSPELAQLLPVDLAEEYRVLPIALDQENNLTLLMSDPTDGNAVDEIGFFAGAYVVRTVATQMQLAWALGHYYGLVTPLGERLLTLDAAPATSNEPLPRAKGLTDKVSAMRHKAISPVDAVPAALADDLTEPSPMPTMVQGDLGRHQMAVQGELTVAGALNPLEPSPAPAATVIVDVPEQNSDDSPILLTRRSKPHSVQPDPSEDEPVILLQRPKKGTFSPRAKRITEIGLGRLSTRPPGVDNSIPIPERVRPSDTQPVYISSDDARTNQPKRQPKTHLEQ